jgi:hypothetical protein
LRAALSCAQTRGRATDITNAALERAAIIRDYRAEIELSQIFVQRFLVAVLMDRFIRRLTILKKPSSVFG